MQPVPYYDGMKTNDGDAMSDQELNIVVVVIYLTAFLFMCQLAMAIHNIVRFLIQQ